MIPNNRTGALTSTLTGEDVAMSLDERATAHLMGILTDIYSDPEMAALREYATNARDSHRQAGNPDPIEIDLPSQFRPTLVIRDRGIGLDSADIRLIYSRYGASTKRDTNDTAGMLGIGCKSALTYTDQFTLVGVKDGERTVVSVSRTDEGGGTMKIVEHGPTDEPNGVTVTIPVKADNDFRDKAESLFRFWEPGSVLLDGEAPDPLTGGLAVGENLRAFPAVYGIGLDESYIVMGGVPYPCEALGQIDQPAPVAHGRPVRRFGRVTTTVRLVAHVEIGTVDFAPSREALMDTPATRRAIEALKAEYAAGAEAAVAAEIDRAATKAKAVEAFARTSFIRSQLNLKTVKWQGRDIPAMFKATDAGTDARRVGIIGKRTNYGYRNVCSWSESVDLERAATGIWITDFDNAQWTGPMRTKLEAYLTEQGLDGQADAERAVLIDGPKVPHPDWIDSARIYSWATIRKWKWTSTAITGAGSPVNRVAGTYVVREPDAERVLLVEKKPAAELTAKTLLYIEGTRYAGFRLANVLNDEIDSDDWQLCIVPANRIAKFKREITKAVEAHAWLKQRAEAWWGSLTPRQRAFCKVEADTVLAQLPDERLDDPELAAAALFHREHGHDRNCKVRATFRRYAGFGYLNARDEPVEKIVDPTDRYPLLDLIGYGVEPRHREDLVLYVNAVYASTEKNTDKDGD